MNVPIVCLVDNLLGAPNLKSICGHFVHRILPLAGILQQRSTSMNEDTYAGRPDGREEPAGRRRSGRHQVSVGNGAEERAISPALLE